MRATILVSCHVCLQGAAELPHFSSAAFRLLAVRPLISLPGNFCKDLRNGSVFFFSRCYSRIVDGMCVAEARETQPYKVLRSRSPNSQFV